MRASSDTWLWSDALVSNLLHISVARSKCLTGLRWCRRTGSTHS